MSEAGKNPFDALLDQIRLIVREVIHEELTANSDAIQCDGDAGLVNAEKAAQYLCVSRAWLYKNANRLPFAKKVGGARRFDMQEMRRWLKGR